MRTRNREHLRARREGQRVLQRHRGRPRRLRATRSTHHQQCWEQVPLHNHRGHRPGNRRDSDCRAVRLRLLLVPPVMEHQEVQRASLRLLTRLLSRITSLLNRSTPMTRSRLLLPIPISPVIPSPRLQLPTTRTMRRLLKLDQRLSQKTILLRPLLHKHRRPHRPRPRGLQRPG